MARVHVDLPQAFSFATEIDVRVTDLNYGNHLGNDALLALLHEARVRFLRHHGMSEGDAGGATIIMADAAIAYRGESFLGDRLRIEVAVGDFARASCDVFYRVTRPSDGKTIAEAKTGLVFLNPQTRKIEPVPEAMRRLGSTAVASLP